MTPVLEQLFTRVFWKLFLRGFTHPFEFQRERATLVELAAMHRDYGLKALAAWADGNKVEFRRYKAKAEEAYQAYAKEWERVTGEACG